MAELLMARVRDLNNRTEIQIESSSFRSNETPEDVLHGLVVNDPRQGQYRLYTEFRKYPSPQPAIKAT